MSDEQPQKIAEVEELRLVSKDGKLRARLFLDEDEPKLALFSKNGKKRVGIGLLPTGEVGLSLYDEDERLHIALIVGEGGTPEISIIDRRGRELDLFPQKERPAED